MKILENQEIVCRLVGCKKNFAEANAKKGDLAVILTREKLIFVEKMLNENRYGYIPLEKLDGLYFEPGRHFLVAEVDEEGYAFSIFADEKDMRKLCKTFKDLKRTRPIKLHDNLMMSKVVTIIPNENTVKKEDKITHEKDKEQNLKEDELQKKEPEDKETLEPVEEAKEKEESADGKMHLSGITLENKESLFGEEEKPIKKKFSLFSKKK